MVVRAGVGMVVVVVIAYLSLFFTSLSNVLTAGCAKRIL